MNFHIAFPLQTAGPKPLVPAVVLRTSAELGDHQLIGGTAGRLSEGSGAYMIVSKIDPGKKAFEYIPILSHNVDLTDQIPASIQTTGKSDGLAALMAWLSKNFPDTYPDKDNLPIVFMSAAIDFGDRGRGFRCIKIKRVAEKQGESEEKQLRTKWNVVREASENRIVALVLHKGDADYIESLIKKGYQKKNIRDIKSIGQISDNMEPWLIGVDDDDLGLLMESFNIPLKSIVSFKNEKDCISEIAEDLFNKNLNFVFGAGFSKSSGAPLEKEISQIIDEKARVKGNDINAELSSYDKYNQFRKIYHWPEWDQFLQSIYYKIKHENYSCSYKTFEKILRLGFISEIYTTNHDSFFNNLLIAAGISHNVVIPWSKKTIKAHQIKIFALNGDISVPKTSNNPQYNSDSLAKVCSNLLKYKTLVVVGCGGPDKNLSEILKGYLYKGNGKVLWCVYDEIPDMDFDLLKRIDFFKITSVDKFMEDLFDNMNSLATDVIVNETVKTKSINKKTICSVEIPGSVCISGDYGVYNSGKMIQYTHHLKTEFSLYYQSVNKSKNIQISTSYCNPFSGEWVDANKNERDVDLENILSEFFNEKKIVTHKNLIIKIKSDYPLNSGLGDPEPAGITKLLLKSGLIESEQAWELFRKIANSKPYYPHTSYLRPMASLVESGMVTLMERGVLPVGCDYKDNNWIENNRKVDLTKIKCRTIGFDGIIAISFLPRSLIENKYPSTADTMKHKDIMTKSFFCGHIAVSQNDIINAISRNDSITVVYGIKQISDIFHSGNDKIIQSYSSDDICKKRCYSSKVSGSGPDGAYVTVGTNGHGNFLEFGAEINKDVIKSSVLLELSKIKFIEATEIKLYLS